MANLQEPRTISHEIGGETVLSESTRNTTFLIQLRFVKKRHYWTRLRLAPMMHIYVARLRSPRK